MIEALTSGLWHTPLGEDDYIYQLTFEDGVLRGRLHRVTRGRQILEIPVTKVVFQDTTIQFEHRGFPAFLGEADLTNGRIEGGIPLEPAFQNIVLTRVESEMWPMTRPRPLTGPGIPADVWSRPEEMTSTGDSSTSCIWLSDISCPVFVRSGFITSAEAR